MSLQNSDMLCGANTPERFWQPIGTPVSNDLWHQAMVAALPQLNGLPALNMIGSGTEGLLDAILAEGQFGLRHWDFSVARRLYYGGLRSLLPRAMRPAMRRLLLAPQQQHSILEWPVEPRFVNYQQRIVRHLIDNATDRRITHAGFWPKANNFAVVLTHDIESLRGMEYVREVADLEERYGFRSAFNVVPREYRIDHALLGELRERGFEIGTHGLDHRGNLFLRRSTFDSAVPQIAASMRLLNAEGFRAPFTHRNPEWMQSLDIAYDASFFDTDPFESIPGGTMSIWPFVMGRFIELPYTLVQDHTLVATLAERTPKLWIEKVDFIERNRGMALVITHPDYLRQGIAMQIYETFLRDLSERRNAWRALPREVASWWRDRHNGQADVSRITLVAGSGDRILQEELQVDTHYPSEPNA